MEATVEGKHRRGRGISNSWTGNIKVWTGKKYSHSCARYRGQSGVGLLKPTFQDILRDNVQATEMWFHRRMTTTPWTA